MVGPLFAQWNNAQGFERQANRYPVPYTGYGFEPEIYTTSLHDLTEWNVGLNQVSDPLGIIPTWNTNNYGLTNDHEINLALGDVGLYEYSIFQHEAAMAGNYPMQAVGNMNINPISLTEYEMAIRPPTAVDLSGATPRIGGLILGNGFYPHPTEPTLQVPTVAVRQDQLEYGHRSPGMESWLPYPTVTPQPQYPVDTIFSQVGTAPFNPVANQPSASGFMGRMSGSDSEVNHINNLLQQAETAYSQGSLALSQAGGSPQVAMASNPMVGMPSAGGGNGDDVLGPINQMLSSMDQAAPTIGEVVNSPLSLASSSGSTTLSGSEILNNFGKTFTGPNVTFESAMLKRIEDINSGAFVSSSSGVSSGGYPASSGGSNTLESLQAQQQNNEQILELRQRIQKRLPLLQALDAKIKQGIAKPNEIAQSNQLLAVNQQDIDTLKVLSKNSEIQAVGNNPVGAGKLASPLAGVTFSQLTAYKPTHGQSFYGERDGGARQHSKVDFDKRVGGGQDAKVQAVKGGTATARAITGTSANVNIKTVDPKGRNVTFVYNHLKLSEVKELFGGDLSKSINVQTGQFIGSVTMDELSTGPHLDFGVMIDDQYVDPQKYLEEMQAYWA